jgi:hypothetical protein
MAGPLWLEGKGLFEEISKSRATKSDGLHLQSGEAVGTRL